MFALLSYCSLTLVFLVSSVALSQAQSLSGDSWSNIKAAGEGTIKVAYYEEDHYAYRNSAGEVEGVQIEIFQHFIKYTEKSYNVDLDVEYIAYNDFPRFYEDVKNAGNGVFGMGNVTITEDRKETIKFSPPYLTNIAILITHEDVSDLRSMEALDRQFVDKKAVVYKGTTHEKRFDKIKEQYFPELDFVTSASDEETIKLVSENPNYFSYVDLSIYWLAKQNGKPIKRHPVGDQTSENFGFIMPQASDWDMIMEEFFDLGHGYRSNPKYQRVLVDYLGVEVTKMLKMAYQDTGSSGR